MTAAFKVKGGTTYEVQAVTPDEAEAVGCPTADFRLVGNHGRTMYGAFMATGTVPGREVRVEGWTSARLGIRALWVPAVMDGWDCNEPLDGWVAF